MQSLIDMIMQLNKAGRFTPGSHISIDNPPFMRLVIENLDERGPDGHPVLSVSHYGGQNGDAMRDPEILFQILGQGADLALQPYYFRNDYIGVEEWSRYRQGQLVATRGSNANTPPSPRRGPRTSTTRAFPMP
jgi:hypothetical protein